MKSPRVRTQESSWKKVTHAKVNVWPNGVNNAYRMSFWCALTATLAMVEWLYRTSWESRNSNSSAPCVAWAVISRLELLQLDGIRHSAVGNTCQLARAAHPKWLQPHKSNSFKRCNVQGLQNQSINTVKQNILCREART